MEKSIFRNTLLLVFIFACFRHKHCMMHFLFFSSCAISNMGLLHIRLNSPDFTAIRFIVVNWLLVLLICKIVVAARMPFPRQLTNRPHPILDIKSLPSSLMQVHFFSVISAFIPALQFPFHSAQGIKRSEKSEIHCHLEIENSKRFTFPSTTVKKKYERELFGLSHNLKW